MPNDKVKRCLELTEKILELEIERARLEAQLTMDECLDLAELHYQTANEKSNEAKNLENFANQKFNVRVLRK